METHTVGWILGGLGLGAGLALFLRPRSTSSLSGAFSDSVEKFKQPDGKSKKVTIFSWSLPPGPPPDGVRKGFESMCRRTGGKGALYRALTGKKGDMARLRKRFAAMWEVGTCPGCSTRCAEFCYPTKTTSAASMSSQRMTWGNLCDVVDGIRLPRVRSVDCAGSKQGICSKRSKGVKKVDGDPDRYSNDVIATGRGDADTVWIRVHVAGDFFDPEYVKLWRNNVEWHLAQYRRDLAAWHRGERKDPPVRVYFWSYTRSWRIGAKRDSNRPDPTMLKELRQLPVPEYPEEIYPAWHEKAGQRRRAARQAFGLNLSADGATGVPWVKDAKGRIMPVAFLLTGPDLLAQDEKGRPAVESWDAKVPGVILRDHELRSLPVKGQEVFNRFQDRFYCLAEVPGKGGKKKAAEGCINCGRCWPGTGQGIAEYVLKRNLVAEQLGVDVDRMTTWDMAKRGAAVDLYEKWKADPKNVFTLAVKPAFVLLSGQKSARIKRQLSQYLQFKARSLPAVGDK